LRPEPYGGRKAIFPGRACGMRKFACGSSLKMGMAPSTLHHAMGNRIAAFLFTVVLLGASEIRAQQTTPVGQVAGASAGVAAQVFVVLKSANYHAYVEQFARDEREATGKDATDPWPWIQAHIPLFESSEKSFEEMYYFRWYAWQKHVVKTAHGFLITEWLQKPDAADGNYYNHSGFSDPLITGLVGLRPREDNKVELNPLPPAGKWNWFALDGLPYHGHLLAVVYDRTGKKYGRGRGLMLYVDGKKIAGRKDLGPLGATLPEQERRDEAEKEKRN